MVSAFKDEQQGRFDLLGKIAWLWMNSPLHTDWTMHLAARFLIPAIESRQLHVIERDGMPVAYCSWAWLSAEAERAYLIDPSTVLAYDWRSGERLWFIDWVAPFGAADSWQLRRAMMERFPNEVARAIRVKREKTKARVMEFKGPALNSGVAHARLKNYYDDFAFFARQQSQAVTVHSNLNNTIEQTEEIHHD
jgi:cytolysin-activating lysine-acyltransferase